MQNRVTSSVSGNIELFGTAIEGHTEKLVETSFEAKLSIGITQGQVSPGQEASKDANFSQVFRGWY